MPSKKRQKGFISNDTPPYRAYKGGGLTFWILALIFCSVDTKLFFGKILGNWDACVNFFDNLSVSHQNKGGVKKKR